MSHVASLRIAGRELELDLNQIVCRGGKVIRERSRQYGAMLDQGRKASERLYPDVLKQDPALRDAGLFGFGCHVAPQQKEEGTPNDQTHHMALLMSAPTPRSAAGGDA
jgi:hypothetical protein